MEDSNMPTAAPPHRDGLTADDLALAQVACERAALVADGRTTRMLAIGTKLAIEAALRHTEEGR